MKKLLLSLTTLFCLACSAQTFKSDSVTVAQGKVMQTYADVKTFTFFNRNDSALLRVGNNIFYPKQVIEKKVLDEDGCKITVFSAVETKTNQEVRIGLYTHSTLGLSYIGFYINGVLANYHVTRER